MRPIRYTLHPIPYTLHPTPSTTHPTPYSLHPSTCTLISERQILTYKPQIPNSDPFNLNPQFLTYTQECWRLRTVQGGYTEEGRAPLPEPYAEPQTLPTASTQRFTLP